MKRGVNKQSSATGAIRIISGQYRGRKLPVVSAQGLRPTTDRLKETLFNWLMPYVSQRQCLDMFAGSGSLGLEALSRYAKWCTFIEMEAQAANNIAHNLQTLNIGPHVAQVQQGDAITLCAKLPQQFDLVFIDPPFHQQLVPRAIDSLLGNNLLAADALIYVESARQDSNYVVPRSWQLLKQKDTSNVASRLYQLNESGE